MTERTHQPCPYPVCGSSDAFSFNEEKGVGKCHSCGESYPSSRVTYDWAKEEYPVKERDTTKWYKQEPSKATFKDIRGLDEDVAKLYQIQGHLDDDGNMYRIALKWPDNVQYRTTDPNFKGPNKYMNKHKGANMNSLFGPEFNAGSSKRLYLTEGGLDAASLYQVLGKTYPVKAIPSASINDRFMRENNEYLDSFQEIVYAGELDDAGRKAADRLYAAYPEKLYYVPMSKHKDPNAFLLAGDEEDLMWAARKPQRFSPENFFCSDDEFLQILREENPYEYTPTGHTQLDSVVRGMVRGGVTFIKAPPGSGKTELIRFLERAMLKYEPAEKDDDWKPCKIAAIHMEEMKATYLRSAASYELGQNVRTKRDAEDRGISEKEVEDAALAAAQGDRTILFEMRAADDPLKLLDYVRIACGIYGADYVFVDHAQRLAYLGGIDGATNILTQLASNLAQLSKELNVGVIMISHVNEDGHTKYAKSLEEEAIQCIRISRDKEAEDEQERNTTTFYVEKNRPFSKLGYAGKVYYDEETTLLSEVEETEFDPYKED